MADLTISPVGSALGAEITGVDVTTLDDDGIAAIRQAVLDHLVVMIRGQHTLGIDGLEAFTARLGEPIETPFVGSLRGHPHVVRVIKEADETSPNFGGGWHSESPPTRSQPPSHWQSDSDVASDRVQHWQ
jgi:taurine dioxygenase